MKRAPFIVAVLITMAVLTVGCKEMDTITNPSPVTPKQETPNTTPAPRTITGWEIGIDTSSPRLKAVATNPRVVRLLVYELDSDGVYKPFAPLFEGRKIEGLKLHELSKYLISAHEPNHGYSEWRAFETGPNNPCGGCTGGPVSIPPVTPPSPPERECIDRNSKTGGCDRYRD